MKTVIQGTTRVYGIIGWPVAHSRSPQMQNAAFQALGMDCVFVPFAVPPSQLAEAVQGLRCLGVAGWNVTIPHKSAIMPFLDQLSPAAVRAGAVNTVCNRNGLLIGCNTDGAGLLISLERDLDCLVAGKRIVVLGAGGAARGAVAALAEAGTAAITVVNRTLATASQLAAELQLHRSSTSVIAAADFSMLPQLLPETDLLINATSLGLHGEEIAGLDLALLPAAAKVYDMVYGASSTPLVSSAQRRGLQACDGLGMLAAQGELAFCHWTGVTPPAGLMPMALQQER
ncbi:shikimate dehydrogenase [Trichlorobacter sp.]|uniref:shikimate dehydrogenase n=1 Tax=Trichlorobacter sp. TaxID=2911007 RepID=UPI002A35D801|nr:shikimate dehydrogenase [Trichlorobacter sp.]MDY0383459.1 shikimate dehydrogenase [Trichlorobacter sp.]